MPSVYDFSATTLDGKPHELAEYQGKTLLIVNTASKCGFTPQYQGLQALQDEYADQGLVVLGFPCNQFGGQEPGSEAEIGEFCSTTFSVSFPLFGKIEVNGEDAHPLYQYLKSALPGALKTEGIKWNFTKFLVGRDGQPIRRYAPTTKPEDLRGDIEKALQA